MSKYLDINALTDEVLASVETEEIEKTASTEEEVKTEIGKAIKEAAANIREHSDTEITNEDIVQLVKAARAKAAMGNAAQGALGGATMGAAAGAPLGLPGIVGGAGVGGLIGYSGGTISEDNPAQLVGQGVGNALGIGQSGNQQQPTTQQPQQQQMQNPAAPAAKMGNYNPNSPNFVQNELGYSRIGGVGDEGYLLGAPVEELPEGANVIPNEEYQRAHQLVFGGGQQQAPQQAANPAAPAAKTGSATGNELRKVANEIRKQGAANEEIKLTKAAKMLTAAVGLSHLTEDVK